MAMPQFATAGKMMGLGHTSLDYYKSSPILDNQNGYVIYAPHWSFVHPGNTRSNICPMSTFLENGELILEFAKKHSGLGWVFKPHPLLYTVLIHSGCKTKEQTDAYFNAWRELGIVHDTPDYAELFVKSRAMITDSVSFTVEYPATGHPIIQMLSEGARKRDPGPQKALYDSYYQTTNNDELMAALDLVLVRNQDPKRESRLREIERAGLRGDSAARRILMHLSDELGLGLTDKDFAA